MIYARRRSERGQALVPVIFVLFILTAFAVSTAAVARREAQTAANSIKETQRALIARGAIQYAMWQLQQITNGGTAYPQLQQPPDTDANGWTQLGDGWYKIEIIDTGSRLNINTATVQQLAALPHFQGDATIPCAIIDWRDADDTPTTFNSATGAESDTYQSLNPPYAAKNAPFDTLNELLLVRGVTPEILYGVNGVLPGTESLTGGGVNGAAGSMSANGALGQMIASRAASRQATPAGGQGGGTGAGAAATPTTPAVQVTPTLPLSEVLTTFGRERNLAADGTARVNVLTATAQQMQTGLGVSQADAQRLITYRTSNAAQFTSVGAVINAGWTRTTLQQVADKICISNDLYRIGFLNINTAPPEVLATVTGMTQQIFDAVVQARQNGTVFNTMSDVLTIEGLTGTQLRVLLDNFTTKTSVYLIRVRSRVLGSPKIYAAEALVELQPPAPITTTTTNGATGTTDTAAPAADTTTVLAPRLLQFREVGRTPGWTSWKSVMQPGGTTP